MPATPQAETTQGRKNLAKQGKAMPGKDGGAPRYPIPNVAYLDKAIRAVGRARPNTDEEHAKVRRYIMRRARELGAESHIPDSWKSGGSTSGN